MLLPMICFFLTLIVLGGIASLATIIDTHSAHRAPFPFACFFAGVTAIIFVMLGGLVSAYVNDTAGGFIVMLIAPTLGLLSGGFLGYRLGLTRRRRVSDEEESRPDTLSEPTETKGSAPIAFERFDTKSHSEAVEVLFGQALPCLPAVTTAEVDRICSQTLTYEIERGQRHVVGSADQLRPIVARNLEKAPEQLYPGQQIIGFQVSIQSQLKFAALSIVVGDAQGSPGYMYGARFWKTTEQIFLLGWEGFSTSKESEKPSPPSYPVEEMNESEKAVLEKPLEDAGDHPESDEELPLREESKEDVLAN